MDENLFATLDAWPLRQALRFQPELEERPASAPASTTGPAVLPRAVLRAVLDSLTDGVVVADTEGRFLLFNAAAERMLGIGPRQVGTAEWSATYGCYLDDGVTPYPADRLPLVRAILGETVHDCEMLIRNEHLHGPIWLSINSSPIKDETGTIRGGVIVFRDISAKKRESQRMQMLSAAVEQTADSVVITNRNGIIEYVNPAAESVSGYSREELVGATPRVFRSNAHPREFYAELWDTLLAGRPFRATIVNQRKSGAVYFSEQTMTPIRDGTGAISHFVSVGKDVTELRKASERESKLRLARNVQERLLPAAPPLNCGLEIAGTAVMADDTGGDFYDYLSLRDGRLGVIIGDVSGHAIDAALVMAETHAYVRSAALAHTDPGVILGQVNEVMVGDVLDGQFVTALLLTFDAGSGSLCYASAGHTAGYVLDRDGRLLHTLDSTGLPLGLFPALTCDTVSLSGLAEGSVIALITDGLLDTENREGVPFGESRALDVIRSSVRRPAAEIVEQVQAAVRDFSDGAPPADDVTVVICRVGSGAAGR